MKLTNRQIYSYCEDLIKAFTNNDIYIPVKVNFYLQKNILNLRKLAEEIERTKVHIGETYGTLNEDGNSYTVDKDNLPAAQKEFDDLFQLEQEVDIHKIPLESLMDDSISLTSDQMRSMMFMIEEDE